MFAETHNNTQAIPGARQIAGGQNHCQNHRQLSSRFACFSPQNRQKPAFWCGGLVDFPRRSGSFAELIVVRAMSYLLCTAAR
jgi:hypothetical protein